LVRRVRIKDHFGEVTGIDIPGEKPGLMPSTDWKRHAYKRAAEQVWFPGETISVGIGQGYMLATPMQLAHAVSAIASRGEIYKPRLVTAVRPAGAAALEQRPVQPEPTLTAVTRDQWQVIVDGMELATGPGSTAAPIARKMFDAYLLPDKAPLADNVSVLGTPL
jgi:penicillin-binding protein 2